MPPAAATATRRRRCSGATGSRPGASRSGSQAAARWPTTSPPTRSSAPSRRSARFDERRPFAPWLNRIVVNRALDVLRSERRLIGGELPFEPAAAAGGDADGDRELLEAVQALPLQRRAVVILRYGVGMSPAEIAAVLDVPVGTVHSRLARALDQLREERGKG